MLLKKKIIIVDYGLGNLLSVLRAVEAVGAFGKISTCARDIESAERIILPGVGAFPKGMEGIRQKNLARCIQKKIREGVPLLGICLGMQLLFEESEEIKRTKGLAILAGKVKKIEAKSLKLPSIGWYPIKIGTKHKLECSLFKNIPANPKMYFLHSYRVSDYPEKTCIAFYNYGNKKIPAIIAKKNVIGCQFHPEKSGVSGLQIIKNFIDLA